MKMLVLPSGERIPRVGQGCMGIGGGFSRDQSVAASHVTALELGIDLGLTFLDTAEVYAAGHSEEIVGRVAKGKREKLFIATKFSPDNHEYSKVVSAAERSLHRLQTDYIDLYQIHWPNPSVPIGETIRAMEDLVASGKVRHIGLSNFSVREMRAAQDALGSGKIFSNQCEYNLFDRFIELDILPYCRETQVVTIAYSPLDKGRTADGDDRLRLLQTLAKKYGRSPSQIALNWLIAQSAVVVIPKAVNPTHIRENAAAATFDLEPSDVDLIDRVCTSEPDWVDPYRIRVAVDGDGGRKVYQTLEEALLNPLGMSPSPRELAEFIEKGEPTKPVRLVRSKKTDNFEFDLVEGRLRYWAWVIAFGGARPVPAYIRSNQG